MVYFLHSEQDSDDMSDFSKLEEVLSHRGPQGVTIRLQHKFGLPALFSHDGSRRGTSKEKKSKEKKEKGN